MEIEALPKNPFPMALFGVNSVYDSPITNDVSVPRGWGKGRDDPHGKIMKLRKDSNS